MPAAPPDVHHSGYGCPGLLRIFGGRHTARSKNKLGNKLAATALTSNSMIAKGLPPQPVAMQHHLEQYLERSPPLPARNSETQPERPTVRLSEGPTPTASRKSTGSRYSFGGEELDEIQFAANIIGTWQALTTKKETPKMARRSSWRQAFVNSDPRRNIVDFFKPGDHRGPLGLLDAIGEEPEGSPSSFFSVWRPTSLDSIRMMMLGKATGKGLNVKGKSAKTGKLAGYVPYIQISEEAHKSKVHTSPPNATVRVYYASAEVRDRARAELARVLAEMTEVVRGAKAALAAERDSGVALDDEVREGHLHYATKWGMLDPTIYDLDEAGHGLLMPERLMWEASVMRRSIAHPPGFETGRPSMPDYMDLNLHATRYFDPEQPRAVVYQLDVEAPLNPRSLLVAYEEEQVLPVASDFDAFLFGSKGVEYPTVPRDQVSQPQPVSTLTLTLTLSTLTLSTLHPQYPHLSPLTSHLSPLTSHLSPLTWQPRQQGRSSHTTCRRRWCQRCQRSAPTAPPLPPRMERRPLRHAAQSRRADEARRRE